VREPWKYNRKAIALAYEGSGAPIVMAKGEGLDADLIIQSGKEAEVPIIEGEALANFLQDIPIGEEIPEVLFESVATLLSWAYWLKGKTPK
jgi:flagellar biosynthesis protein|tara:strand:+ start:891 stop:1163 length:273 start_codon:yes stop_codon:yes gene_type:complete